MYESTTEKEKEKIRHWNESKKRVGLIVRDISNHNDLVAWASAEPMTRRSVHVYELAIVVRKKAWRQGIGRTMMLEMMQRTKAIIGALKFHLDMLIMKGHLSCTNLLGLRCREL